MDELDAQLIVAYRRYERTGATEDYDEWINLVIFREGVEKVQPALEKSIRWVLVVCFSMLGLAFIKWLP